MLQINKIQIKISSRSHNRKWREILACSLLPFILWGVPIHKLFQNSRRISHKNGFLTWLHHLFSIRRKKLIISVFSTLLTFLLLSLAVYFNFLVCHAIFHFIFEVLARGRLEDDILQDLVTLFQFLPLVIPLNYIWFRGYKFRQIFNYFSLAVDLNYASTRIRYIWFKIGAMYILLGVIHSIQIFVSQEQAGIFENSNFGIIRYWIGYSTEILYSLIIPHYLTLIFVIKDKYKILNKSIRKLLKGDVQVQVDHLIEIKTSFKITSEICLQVNKIFRGFVTWSIFVILFGILRDAVFIILSIFLMILGRKEPGTFSGLFWILISSLMAAFGWIDKEIEVYPTDSKNIRGIFLHFGMIFLKLAIIQVTRRGIKNANDEARNVLVCLNDFVSEQKLIGISIDVYHKFRSLKFYIFSRWTRPDSTLLAISLTNWIPFLNHEVAPIEI